MGFEPSPHHPTSPLNPSTPCLQARARDGRAGGGGSALEPRGWATGEGTSQFQPRAVRLRCLPGRVQLPRGRPETRAAPPQAAPRGAARRAPTNVQPSFFGSLGCSSWGAKHRSCAYKHRHSEPSESLGLSEAAPRSVISTSAPDTPHPKGRRRQHWRNARPGEIERTALEPREHK